MFLSRKSTPFSSYTHWTARAVVAALVALVGCSDAFRPAERPPASVPTLPSAAIQDGAHATGGYPGFFFLTPLVPAPHYGGAADGSLAPTVKVCEWVTSAGAPGACAQEVARFSTTTGTGAELVRYDATAYHYIVNWRTDVCTWGSCTLDPTKVYRLRVFVGSVPLGFADVKVVPSMQQARNAAGETIALVNGRTLPVKFRIEKGRLTMAATNGTPTPVGASGATLATADGAVALAIPPGAVSGSTGITVEPVPSAEVPPAPNLVPGTAYQFGPDGTQFAQPVTLTLGYDPTMLPAGVQETNLTLYNILSNGGLEKVPFTQVNTVDKTVKGAVNHFSEYAVGNQAPVAAIRASGLNVKRMGEQWIAEDAGASRTYVYLLDADGNGLHGRTVAVTQSNPAVLQLGEIELFANPGHTENYEAAGFDISVLSTGTTTVTVSSEGLNATFTIHVVARSHELGAAALDFSPSANPNGPWSAGYITTLGSPLKLYRTTLQANGLQYWLDPVNNQANTPGFYKNVSGAIVYGSAPGQVSLHPGCSNGELSVLRWTAPTGGRYAVQAQFLIGDHVGAWYGETTAHILLNSNALSPLFYAARTSPQPTFSQSLFLGQGETIDFVVGVGDDGCLHDTTPIAVTITPALPEPFDFGQAALEFSATQNPNGSWSSGWMTSLGGQLNLYTVSDDDYDGRVYWIDPPSGPGPVYEPNFNKNITNEYQMSSSPGQVSLTPGPCQRPFSVLRWTAPAAGTYAVDARFYRGMRSMNPNHYGETTAHILRNGNAAAPLFFSPGTLISPTFAQTLTLMAGETIDLVVGPLMLDVNCFYSETPVSVTITPVP